MTACLNCGTPPHRHRHRMRTLPGAIAAIDRLCPVGYTTKYRAPREVPPKENHGQETQAAADAQDHAEPPQDETV